MFSTSTDSDPSTAHRRWFVGLALALAAVVALSTLAATSSQAADSDKASTTLKIAIASEIDTLNPFTAILASSTGVMALQYEALVAYGAKDNSVVPGIASKWATSADGLTWTFTIPKDRVWSDGEPLTANDVAWTFGAVKSNEKLQQANGGLLTNIKTVTAEGDQTVKIVLIEAQAPNPGAELPIVPEHVWSGVNKPEAFANDKDAVGSGPFVVKSYKQGQSVELVANKNFWRGAPKIDGITYVYYKNSDAAVQGLKTGEVDLVRDLEPAQFKALKGQKGITTNAGAGRRYTSVNINSGAKDAKGAPLGNGNPALKDVALRTAIFSAIDNKTLLTKVQQGLGTLGQTEVPPVYPSYYGIDPADVIKFDPVAANTMLDGAGYKRGSDGMRTDKTGEPLDLRLMGRTSNPQHAQMADYIKPWLKEIGINVEVTMQSDNQVNNDSTLGKYDLYFTGFGLGPDPDFQLSVNTCSSYPNSDGSGSLSENNWCDPAFDTLFTAQHTELDSAKRAIIAKDAFAMIYKAAVNDVIFYAQSLEAYRSDRFGGFDKQPATTGVIGGQNGYWGYYSATPVSASSDNGDGFPIWATILIIVVLAGAVTAVAMRRRGANSEDRE
ncbi:MAG: ABC transporter substrate-binding protein [Kineosporiaceae bacterium]|nr:ABC transporter substrate-binding protein [Aeromicrobium sp.]